MAEASEECNLGCSGLGPCEWFDIPESDALGGECNTNEELVIFVGVLEKLVLRTSR